MKYRKKPVVIEAYRLPACGTQENIPTWVLQAALDHLIVPQAAGGATIKTLEGTMTANVGDWIIKGVKGELYPCKPDIFEATYEAVDE